MPRCSLAQPRSSTRDPCGMYFAIARSLSKLGLCPTLKYSVMSAMRAEPGAGLFDAAGCMLVPLFSVQSRIMPRASMDVGAAQNSGRSLRSCDGISCTNPEERRFAVRPSDDASLESNH
eukprot:2817569-Prymnesium_polylepis.1